MTNWLSTAERNKLTAHVVQSLDASVSYIQDYLRPSLKSSLLKNTRGSIAADGSFSIIVPGTDPKAAGSFVPASHHQIIAHHAFMKELTALFEPAAKALARLLPGQTLTWGVTVDTPMRHKLTLGASQGGNPVVIDTALSRWKAPLARLSSYLETVDQGDGSLKSWRLQNGPDAMTDQNHYESNSLRVDARSADEAVRLAAFARPSGATPKPSHDKLMFVSLLADVCTHDQYIEAISRRLAETSHHSAAIRKTYEAAENETLPALREVIGQVSMLASVTIDVDLRTGHFTHQLKASPLVSKSDLARLPDLEADLRIKVQSYLDPAYRAFQAIHPRSSSASLRLQASCTRSIRDAHFTIAGTVDNMPYWGGFSSMAMFLTKVTTLAAAFEEGPTQLYSLEAAAHVDEIFVGVDHKVTQVEASSFAHAAVLLGAKFSQGYVLREVTPIPFEMVDAARNSRLAALSAYE